ncbi:hypothetical protein, partial [Staphylococcus epidermidis]|uniref:hypothetical protein n=1 Tax=Staphylococcus epidermidis TaxID=1282 RepID=UPI003F68A2B8
TREDPQILHSFHAIPTTTPFLQKPNQLHYQSLIHLIINHITNPKIPTYSFHILKQINTQSYYLSNN